MSDLRVPRLVDLGGAPLAASRVGEAGAGIATEVRAEAFAASATLEGHELAEIRARLESLCGPPAAQGRDPHGVEWCAFRLPFAILLASRAPDRPLELHLEPFGKTKPVPTFEPDVASWLAERRASTTRVVTPTRVPPAEDVQPLYKALKGGRLAETEQVRTLVRWLVRLAAGPVTLATIDALAQREKLRRTRDGRWAIPATRTELIAESARDDAGWLMVWLGKVSKPGRPFDQLFGDLAKDVDGELGKPARSGRDQTDHKDQWRVYRTGGAIVVLAQHDDWLRQHGQAVSLQLFTWPAGELPDLGDPAVDWITREARRRTER